MSTESLLAVVDMAYSIDGHDEVWITDLMGVARRAFGETGGALAYRFRIDEAQVHPSPDVAGDSLLQKMPEEGHSTLSAEYIVPFYEAPPYASRMSHTYGRFAGAGQPWLPPELRGIWERMGFSDMLGVFCGTGDGDGIAVGFAIPRGRAADHLDWRRVERGWTAVAHHLARAVRFRRSLQEGAGVAADFDARGRGDFSPAAASSRRDLVESAARIERALSHHGDERAALDLWQEVLSGRWSIVRRRRADGRVRFLAVENPPQAAWLRELQGQERAVAARVARGESNKVIAMELDLHESSVAEILRRAMRKLGVCQRVHLARLATAGGFRPALRDLDRIVELPLDEEDLPACLTDAEREIARLVLAGCDNAEIAERRARSYRTIANQLASIYGKLGVANRTELVAKLAGRGTRTRRAWNLGR